MIIPTSVRDNDIFREDLARFVRSSTALKQSLYKDVKLVPPYGTLSDTQINHFSNELSHSYEEIQRIVSVFSLIRQQLLETGQTPEEAVSDIESLIGKEIVEASKEDLQFAFTYPAEERAEYLALQTLIFGPAYLSSSLRPSLVATAEGAELVGVHFMTISYLNTEAEQKTVTLGITPGELEQLESSIAEAKRRLETVIEISGAQSGQGLKNQ